MRLKSLLFIAAAAIMSLAVLLLVQCAPVAAEFKLGDASTVLPMPIKQGATEHFMTDYYPQWEGADNVTCNDARLNITPKNDSWTEFEVATEAETLVSTIDVWHGDQKLSIVVLGGVRDTADSYMSSTAAADGVITIEASQPVTEAVAMWQNNRIEDITVEGNKITVEIPAVAKKFDRSMIRVYAASETGRFNDILLPLEKGVVVTDAEQIRRKDFHSQILYSLMIDRFCNGNTANDWKINSPEV